jgi:DNA-binding LacI/PurR family transcriptional regulator
MPTILEQVFSSSDPPTAIVATRSRHVLTLITWLAKRRLQIPTDLSLIALCHEPWYEHLIPSITHYHLSPEMTARATARKVERVLSGSSPGSQPSLLIPECLQGDSVQRLRS